MIVFSRATLSLWNASVSSERLRLTQHPLLDPRSRYTGSLNVAFQLVFVANIGADLHAAARSVTLYLVPVTLEKASDNCTSQNLMRIIDIRSVFTVRLRSYQSEVQRSHTVWGVSVHRPRRLVRLTRYHSH